MTLNGAPTPSPLRCSARKADAWDEGHHAGHEEARAVHPTYPDPTPNPYRQTEGA